MLYYFMFSIRKPNFSAHEHKIIDSYSYNNNIRNSKLNLYYFFKVLHNNS